jgi:hypothetical protein
MKRVMAGLVAGVVVICLLTSPLAAYDRDITLPSPNQSDPVWMYRSDSGDDSGWTDPHKTNGSSDNSDKFRERNVFPSDRDSWFGFFRYVPFIWQIIVIPQQENDDVKTLR